MRLTAVFAAVFCLASVASALPLGIGGDFDVIVRNNFTARGAHVHGSTLVGGSLVLEGNMSEFGNRQPTGTGANVVVNGQVIMNAEARANGDGIVHVGNLGAGQSVNGSQDIVISGGKTFYANQTTVGPTGIDVEAAFETFIAYSDYLANLTPTLDASVFSSGTIPNKRFNLTSDLDNPFEVITLTGNQLKQYSDINVASLAGSPGGLIINVDLTDYNGGTFVQNRNHNGDAGADWILWNFYGASSVSFDRQFIGTIFAPEMEVIHGGNDLLGAVIADSFVKNGGQVHRHRYAGDIPPPASVPDGGMTVAMLVFGMGALVAIRRWVR